MNNKPLSVLPIVWRNFIKNIGRYNRMSRRQKSEERMRFASIHRRQTYCGDFLRNLCNKKILIVCRARMFPPTFQRGSSLITNNRIQIQQLSELLRHLYFGCSFKSLILFMTCTHRCWTVLYTFKANFSTKLYGIRSLIFLVLYEYNIQRRLFSKYLVENSTYT